MPGAAKRNLTISSAQRQSLGWPLVAVHFFSVRLMPGSALAEAEVVVMEETEEREFVVVSSVVRSISGMAEVVALRLRLVLEDWWIRLCAANCIT